ncbi:hypothetical protein GKR75_08165 [Providencia sp. wls1919]|nr:hypothetical protein [Providencia sp. wls1919]
MNQKKSALVYSDQASKGNIVFKLSLSVIENEYCLYFVKLGRTKKEFKDGIRSGTRKRFVIKEYTYYFKSTEEILNFQIDDTNGLFENLLLYIRKNYE